MRRYPANSHLRPVPSALVDDLVADWRQHGREAIRRVRQWAPQRYIQLVAALAPPGMSDADKLNALSDAELMKEYHDAVAREHAAGTLPPFLRFVPLGDD